MVIGLIGSTLDRGRGADRWNLWRPTVDLCRHEDLLVSRLELLHGRQETALAEVLSADIKSVSPETTVKPHVVDFGDPWDFEMVYGALHEFAAKYPFDPEREDYLVHVTTGTHVGQICLFLLTESRYLPGRCFRRLRRSGTRRRSRGPTRSSISICRSTTASPRGSPRNSARICHT